MKRHGLWAEEPPSPSHLDSQAPFAVDTLTFCQWLQFILLPKLSAMLHQQRPLPAMAIAPAAEVYLPKQIDAGQTEIIALLHQLDRVVAGHE